MSNEHRWRPNLNFVDLEDLKLLNWNVQDLLIRIGELDRSLYPHNCQAMDSLRQWLPVFSQHPESWRAIVSKGRDLAAYWQTAVVEEELYLALKSGAASEADLDADSYLALSEPGIHNLYFVSVCVSPAFRSAETNMALMDSFFSVLGRLAEKNVFFDEITGSACSPDGEQICRTFRLDYLRDNTIGKIYSGAVGDVIERFRAPLATRCPGLFERYRDAGLC